ncbi:acetolactate decarboxylase [Methanoculleus sp. FWC-SCC1]|uniref:Alpha-acetolactate decarboxylase n=1 Tax=Methanoculleus frigidifontis TaxID=2584085 RepID=A0ABT8MCU3_9EURY|nr:acetolactate decarboxylase [Methanoculleus sp. FWC-SCC1]MDN7025767.1 acetolactate decarboxylase [Methanoculleus sp. FWC-SCC1]
MTSFHLLSCALGAVVLVLIAFSAGLLLGSAPERDVLYQVSTIDALLQGVYDGVAPIDDLARHGDFGLGCFDTLDGELIGLDGVWYRIPADGRVRQVPGNATVPFAAVTFFEPDITLPLTGPVNLTGCEARLDTVIPSENLFYAVRIDGTFATVTARSEPAQEKPYRPLVDVIEDEEVVFHLENVTGTVVGFRTPALARGVNIPGYHLHFITGDRTAGGHILDFYLLNGTAAIDVTPDFLMRLPTEGDFCTTDLTLDQQEALVSVEK